MTPRPFAAIDDGHTLVMAHLQIEQLKERIDALTTICKAYEQKLDELDGDRQDLMFKLQRSNGDVIRLAEENKRLRQRLYREYNERTDLKRT